MKNNTTLTDAQQKQLFEHYELTQIADIVDDFFGGGGPTTYIEDINILMQCTFPNRDPMDDSVLTIDEIRDLQNSMGHITSFLSRLYETTSNHTSVKSKYGIRLMRDKASQMHDTA